MNLIEETKQSIELIKHTAAIHIKSNLSLVERKMINILLKNAYDELDSAKYHTIRLQEIRNAIGWKGKNYNGLKNALNKLVSTKIEWNILKKDKKNIWVTSSFLASASISSGRCVYDYSYHLRELFKNPNIYGKINLLIQNNFKSKYSLILWEFLTDHLSIGNKDLTQTDWIKIEDYKNLLGAEPEKYKTFKVLNANLIKLPLKEINKVSDITAKAHYQKSLSNHITEIKFSVKRKAKSEQEAREDLPLLQQIEDDKPTIKSEKIEDELKKDLLKICRFSAATANKILKDYEQKQLIENLKYIKSETSKGLIKNISAYSFNAIKNDFRLFSPEEKIIEKPAELKEKTKKQINNNHQFWIDSISKIKTHFDEKVFVNWLSKLNFICFEDDKINGQFAVLHAESKFVQNWVIQDYKEELEKILNKKLKIIHIENL